MIITTVTATLHGVTPYEPGRYYIEDSKEGESPDKFDERTWRSRAHIDSKGMVHIDGMCFKRALEISAKTLAQKIKGARGATYTKFFERAVIPIGHVELGIKKKDLDHVALFVPANGKDGARVTRRFPIIEDWHGELKMAILDPIIPEKIFRDCLDYASNFIGVGTFRPERGGMCGRFEVESFDWDRPEEETESDG